MKKSILLVLLNLTLMTTSTAFADESLYCTAHHRYIKIGMPQRDVIAACGKPHHVKKGPGTVMKKIPVKQMLYKSFNNRSLFQGWDLVYDTWNLPKGTAGTTVAFNVLDDKIIGIQMNGNDTNATSMCYNERLHFGLVFEKKSNQGVNIQKGDHPDMIKQHCGNPNVINTVYKFEPVPDEDSPEVWKYLGDFDQKPFKLSFVRGRLVGINE